MASARMIYAASETSANMLYAVGLFVPDPFLFIQEENGKRHLLISALEVDRARSRAKVDQVHDWQDIRTRHFLPPECGEAPLILAFLREYAISHVVVPDDFPLGLADALRRDGLRVDPHEGPFWPQRAQKNDAEIAAIREALHITGCGMQAGIELIRSARIGQGDQLFVDDLLLTSEWVRGEIEATLVRLGAMPSHTIVSGGLQGADPHEAGFGPLYAHQPIILDIFPRMMQTGYWGDMTRTICRGKPPERLVRAWEAVRSAQESAFQEIRANVSGLTIHQAVTATLTAAGFPTGLTAEGRQSGFFHGTGHGLGLEVHEPPRISQREQVLLAGHVVTVEPGLYYPDWGGVRLEDVVMVQKDNCLNLTDFPKFFEV